MLDISPLVDTTPLLDTTPLDDTAARSPLRGWDPAAARVGTEIAEAAQNPGVFQVVGHGVDPALRVALQDAAREFFALPDETKATIAMALAGRAWRGWFPIGGELTGGVPDAKEGLYFGVDLDEDDPRVRAGWPLHGPNLYPQHPAALARLVPEWMAAVTAVGHTVLRGLGLGLGLGVDAIAGWCTDPTVLFRIFHYPALDRSVVGLDTDGVGNDTDGVGNDTDGVGNDTDGVGNDTDGVGNDGTWGVGEHTDYGLLTLLAQDDSGGLQVQLPAADGDRWVDVPPVQDAFVANLGDMIERLSGGRLVATPHRVAPPNTDRISMPLFLDPGWDVEISTLDGLLPPSGRSARRRWDDEDVHAIEGPYSRYLLSRVSRVFPGLSDHLTPGDASTGAAPTANRVADTGSDGETAHRDG